MARSKDIAFYFDVGISELRAGADSPVDIHLYLPQNRHLILLRRAGDALTADTLERYISRGVKRIWIHQDDKNAWLAYLGPESTSEALEDPIDETPTSAEVADTPLDPINPVEAASEQTEPEKSPQPATPEGAALAAVLASDEIPEESKQEILSGTAQDLIAAVTMAESETAQKEATQKAKQIIRDVLAGASKDQPMVGEIWEMAETDPELEHPVNVATFAVMFAMAFGKVDAKLIADLAMASLLHDIGLAQLPMSLGTQPMKSLAKENHKKYGEHVSFSVSLVKRLCKGIPQRVVDIIQQHHEKFDGTGFPKGVHGFNINDAAQLMSMADLLDTVSSGGWDGKRRHLRDSFKVIEELEKKKSFPQFFNPELFGKVVRWAKSDDAASKLGVAADVVQNRTHELFDSKAKGAKSA